MIHGWPLLTAALTAGVLLWGRIGHHVKREASRFIPSMLDPKLPRAAIDVAILAHTYREIENPYEFLYRLWASLDGGARVAVVDMDKRTEHHGTLPALLRCEMAAVGFRQVDFTELAPADGYLAVFAPPEALPAIATIKPCRP